MKLANIYKTLCQDLPEHDARFVLKQRAGVQWADIIGDPDREIDQAQIFKDLDAIKAGQPITKLYGRAAFWGLEFYINQHVLDPRSDSETIIEAALSYFKDKAPPKTILDLGTGSGCLIISLLKEFPDATGVAVDRSQEALNVAKINAKALGVDDRMHFIQGHWCESVRQKFDLIVANPPYIREHDIANLDENVKNHDPILALDGGKDGLNAYRDIFTRLKNHMYEASIALFEIGFDQADDIARLSEDYKIRIKRIHHDLAGNPRVVEITQNKE